MSFNFFYKLNNCVLRCIAKSTAAMKRYICKDEKTDPESFCKAVMASGTEWACDGLGDWYFIKRDHFEKDTIILEFIEYYELVPEIRNKCTLDKRLLALSLAAFFDVGLLLPVKTLYQRKKHHAGKDNPADFFSRERAINAADKRGKKNRIRPNCVECPFNSPQCS
ncbi:Uncharacterised protein [Cedecea neteri]|uniref:Uncharacterized protein n=1 Tax=Cedecea neteri TaxID=158822 RepID=A0A2X3J0Y6_9ENTR|nr:hypothetical protein [Cedecea neteri]SQC92547.1 Uncharacterised protein [Cedecea neteri]